jgi:hypothetical protein
MNAIFQVDYCGAYIFGKFATATRLAVVCEFQDSSPKFVFCLFDFLFVGGHFSPLGLAREQVALLPSGGFLLGVFRKQLAECVVPDCAKAIWCPAVTNAVFVVDNFVALLGGREAVSLYAQILAQFAVCDCDDFHFSPLFVLGEQFRNLLRFV